MKAGSRQRIARLGRGVVEAILVLHRWRWSARLSRLIDWLVIFEERRP